MSDYYPSPIPGIWIPPVSWSQEFSIVEVFEYSSSLGNYVYVENLFGIPFHVEVYAPLLSSCLMAYQFKDIIEIVETDNPSVGVLTMKREVTTEFSGNSDPCAYLSTIALHSAEELFFDEDGNFSLPTAINTLVRDLIRWRTLDVVSWEEVASSSRILNIEIYASWGGVKVRDELTRGGRRVRPRRYTLYCPPFDPSPTPEFRLIDQYIDDNGFILNFPLYDEVKKEEERLLAQEVVR